MRSIFLKIFLVVFTTGLIVNFLVYFGMRNFGMPPRDGRIIIDKNIHLYLENLAQKIGLPPDHHKAAAIARETSLAVRVEANGDVYASEPHLEAPRPGEGDAFQEDKGFGGPPRRPNPMHSIFGGPDVDGKKPPRPRHTIKIDNVTYTFYAPEPVRIGGRYEVLLTVLALVTVLLASSYFAIRSLLQPLHSLNDGVAAVAAGNVSHRVPVGAKDELGRLAQAFNNMTERIQAMIAAKERLLLDVSHELQSPLGRLKIATSLLKDDIGKERINRDVGEMEKMVIEILESARLDSSPGALNLSNIELVSLIQEHLQVYREQNAPLTFKSSAYEIYADVDPARLVTVLRNLVDNALKYSSDATMPVEIHLDDLGQEVELTVKDFGIGIPAEEMAQLFEPFYRADKSRSKKTGGYGLGLSLCQRIVTAHGGRIVASHNHDEPGITMHVILPKHLDAQDVT